MITNQLQKYSPPSHPHNTDASLSNFTTAKLGAAVSAATSGSDSVSRNATSLQPSLNTQHCSTLQFMEIMMEILENLKVFLAVTLTSLTSISAGQAGGVLEG